MDAPDEEDLRYGLEHLAGHLAASGDTGRLDTLISPEWLKRKRQHLGIDAYRSLAGDLAHVLARSPAGADELPRFLRMCVLAGTVNTVITGLPSGSFEASARGGQISSALASAQMIASPYERARALQAIAAGRAATDPEAAADMWHRSADVADTLADHAHAGRLLASAVYGLAELGRPVGHLREQAKWHLAAGASLRMPVVEAYIDLARSDVDAVHLANAVTALEEVDEELSGDVNRLVSPLRLLAEAAVRAQNGAVLEALTRHITTDRAERPGYLRPSRASIALAALAVGAADGGEHEVAEFFLEAAFLESKKRTHESTHTDPYGLLADATIWSSAQIDAASRAAATMACLRIDIQEEAALAWAVAVVLPDEATDVRVLIDACVRRMRELTDEEEAHTHRARFGLTRRDLRRGDDVLDPSIVDDERQQNLLAMSYAAARSAMALQQIDDAEGMHRRVEEAILLTARMRGGREGVVDVLLALNNCIVESPAANAARAVRIVDAAQVNWKQAFDTTLNGTLNFAEIVDRVVPARAAAGDIAWIHRVASEAPPGRAHDHSKAVLAIHLAQAGDVPTARRLARTVRPGRTRTVAAARTWAALSETYGLTGDWIRQRRAQRKSRNLSGESPDPLDPAPARDDTGHDGAAEFDVVESIARGAVDVVELRAGNSRTNPNPFTVHLSASAVTIGRIDPQLQTRIWEEVHALRSFWLEAASTEPAATPADGREADPDQLRRQQIRDYLAFAESRGRDRAYIRHRLRSVLFRYPVSLAITWLAITPLAWIGGGEHGPLWVVAGTALNTAVNRRLLSHAYASTPPSRRVVRPLAAATFILMTIGAWSHSVGLVMYWLPGLFSQSHLAVGILFALSMTMGTYSVRHSARKLATGGDIPYR